MHPGISMLRATGYAQSPVNRKDSSFSQRAKSRREGSSRNSNKAQGTVTTNTQLSEPKGSRACVNLKKPSSSAGRGLQCHARLLMRTAFFTDTSCWTEARSICSKETLPGSANFPIKPLFGLIPFFFSDSREQRADVKRMASNSKYQHLSCPQHPPCDSTSGWLTELWRCPSSSWEIAALKGSGVLVTALLFVQRLGE